MLERPPACLPALPTSSRVSVRLCWAVPAATCKVLGYIGYRSWDQPRPKHQREREREREGFAWGLWLETAVSRRWVLICAGEGRVNTLGHATTTHSARVVRGDPIPFLRWQWRRTGGPVHPFYPCHQIMPYPGATIARIKSSDQRHHQKKIKKSDTSRETQLASPLPLNHAINARCGAKTWWHSMPLLSRILAQISFVHLWVQPAFQSQRVINSVATRACRNHRQQMFLHEGKAPWNLSQMARKSPESTQRSLPACSFLYPPL